MVMFKTWNLLFQIVSGRTISRATGRATLRPVVPPIGCSLTLWNVEMFLGFRSLPIRRPTLLIIRSIVGGHDRSYDRSFMATISRTIFSNRCWSRDHAYDQSYDDLPPGRKTDRSMRSLLAIVANIADRSHVRQIATDRTIKQSYDPVWQWLYVIVPPVVHGGTTSCGWSQIGSRTIDRTIGRTMLRLTVRSIVAPHDWSYDRPSGATIDRMLGHSMPRVLVRLVTYRITQLLVRSVAGCKDWSYHRSPAAITDRTSVIRFPKMALAVDILQSFVISRPRSRDRSPYATSAGDRSKHCRSVAPWPNRNQSYDP